MYNATEIRLKILKSEGMGFSKAETVKNVSEILGCTKQAIYYHYTTRNKWQKQFLDFNNAPELRQTILSRLNHVFRESSFQYSTADNSNAKVGALRLMMDVTMNLAQFLPKEMQPDRDIHVTADWSNKLQSNIDELIKFSRVQTNSSVELLKQYDELINSEGEKVND